MTRKPIRGRRAAPSTGAAAPKVILGGSAAKVAVVPPSGDYALTIAGARAVTSRAGATNVVLSVTDEHGRPITLRPLLVASPGGDSDLVYQGRATLETLLDLGEDEAIDLNEVLDKLSGTRFEAELEAVVDHRGQMVSEIACILSVNGVDTEQ